MDRRERRRVRRKQQQWLRDTMQERWEIATMSAAPKPSPNVLVTVVMLDKADGVVLGNCSVIGGVELMHRKFAAASYVLVRPPEEDDESDTDTDDSGEHETL